MAVMGLTGCTSALSKNVLRGKLVRYEEQQSDYERMKVSVFRSLFVCLWMERKYKVIVRFS